MQQQATHSATQYAAPRQANNPIPAGMPMGQHAQPKPPYPKGSVQLAGSGETARMPTLQMAKSTRQNSLCIGCHAPSAMSFRDGVMSPNASFRLAAEDVDPYERELSRPTTGGLLRPPGRAIEEEVNPDLDMETVLRRRRFTFQGITCDACHKVGQPFDDLTEEDDRVEGPICREDTL